MKRVVYILVLINLAFSVPEQKWRETFTVKVKTAANFILKLKKNTSDCARKNMSLIAIDTYAKHQQIDNLLKRLYTACPSVWIGAHDNAVHLRFEWISTGQAFSFTNWGPGQPADTLKDEHCLLMWTDFQWHDYPCDHKLGYICEENQLVKNVCHRPKFNTNGINMGEMKNIFFYFNNGN